MVPKFILRRLGFPHGRLMAARGLQKNATGGGREAIGRRVVRHLLPQLAEGRDVAQDRQGVGALGLRYGLARGSDLSRRGRSDCQVSCEELSNSIRKID